MAHQPHNFPFAALERRRERDAVAFKLDLRMAEESAPVDDPSACWPEDRKWLAVGRPELTRPITLEEIGDRVMIHDPAQVATDGIEVAPNDQIMTARRRAYLVSAAPAHRRLAYLSTCKSLRQITSTRRVH